MIRPEGNRAKGKRLYIVVDFEATCWEDESRRGDGEIIEFGCIKMSQRNGRIIDEFASFVRPVRYPRLSEYCTRLTGIDQGTVDSAPSFVEVLERCVAWIGDPLSATLCSWGAFDRFLLRQACRFNRVPYPFDDEYINIKPAFSEQFSGRGVSMERALEMLSLPRIGKAHSGIDDARNAARLWQAILKEQRS